MRVIIYEMQKVVLEFGGKEEKEDVDINWMHLQIVTRAAGCLKVIVLVLSRSKDVPSWQTIFLPLLPPLVVRSFDIYRESQ